MVGLKEEHSWAREGGKEEREIVREGGDGDGEGKEG